MICILNICFLFLDLRKKYPFSYQSIRFPDICYSKIIGTMKHKKITEALVSRPWDP